MFECFLHSIAVCAARATVNWHLKVLVDCMLYILACATPLVMFYGKAVQRSICGSVLKMISYKFR